jgi:hypothetical protein
VIILPSLKVFGILNCWLYGQKIAICLPPDTKGYLSMLMDLWWLADELGTPALQNEVMIEPCREDLSVTRREKIKIK